MHFGILAFDESAINVPVALLVWLGGLLLTALGAGIIFCGRELMGIKTVLVEMNVSALKAESARALVEQDTKYRLDALERHDKANTEQSSLLLNKILAGTDFHHAAQS